MNSRQFSTISVVIGLGLLFAACTRTVAGYSPSDGNSGTAYVGNWNACDYECRKVEVRRVASLHGCGKVPEFRSGDRAALMDLSHEAIVDQARKVCGEPQIQTASVVVENQPRVQMAQTFAPGEPAFGPAQLTFGGGYQPAPYYQPQPGYVESGGVYRGKNFAVGMRGGGRPGLNPQEQEQLNRLLDRKSVQMLGSRAGLKHDGFRPNTSGRPVECAGGKVIKQVRSDGGRFFRVWCPSR